MENARHGILYSTLGAVSGLAGLSAMTQCTGAGCPTCLGCAIPGLGIALLALIGRMRGGKQDHGMAQDHR